ncbi:MAG: hypothetical protein J3Q66DRAFT_316992 [Benniella sp.]|nr:MAG: hypothetical protein J3Q66DRAFT_316992 [Benniella sp.]
MSSTNAAINPETTHSGRDSLSPSAGRAGASPGPWRSTSLAARSPSPSYSNSFRDSDSTGHSHRSHAGANSSEQRQRPHPVASSSSGGWSSRRGNERSQGDLHSNTLSSSAFGSFSRSTNTLSSSPSVGAGAAATSPGAGAGGLGAGASANVQKQPLNMEDLAAKFADSKEAKEKFAALQLSPALAPADKERRTPMGSFVPPSSHFAHIKVQRTASLNQNAHSPLLTRGAGGRLQPGHVAQSTEMRRTASHNNAFSSGLGTSLGSSSGALDHSSSGHLNGSSSTSTSPTTANGSHSIIGGGGGGGHGSSAQLAPFSLSQLAPRAPRRSSPQPPEHRLPSPQDQVLQAPTSTPSPLTADKHPLQHTWTLYYDVNTGYNNRHGSSNQNYENNLKELGTFSTVELFARYFNWIEKPHKMEHNTNYHMFKDGIKPMWEDPANANGGRWVINLLSKNTELLDRYWMELAYSLVGEQLDAGDDICGAVLSRRPKADRLAVWVRDKENVEAVNGIGKRLVRILDLAKENISLDFLITTETRSSGPPKNYITLDTIRSELAEEARRAASTPQSSSPETPTLTVDSISATPASATAPSPGTPPCIHVEGDMDKEEPVKENPGGGAGLLISVEGKDGAF